MTWVDFIVQEWALFGLLAAMVAGFLFVETKKGGKTISLHEATRLINRDEAILLDVRDAADYKAGHIVDAVNMPYSTLANKVDELDKYTDKQIIVVDKMGQHAGAAGKILRDKGFNVVRMQGGISEWTNQSLPLVKA